MSNPFIETVKFLISNSPCGFITHIDKTLRKLKPDLVLQNETEYSKILKEAEENEFRQIAYGESTVLVSPYNKKEDSYLFQTQSEHIKFKINPFNENLCNLEKIEINSPIRDKLVKAMEDYINKYYPSKSINNIINDLKKKNPSSTSGPSLSMGKQEMFITGQDKDQTAFYVNMNDLGGNNFDCFITISSHHLSYSNNQTAKWICFYNLKKETEGEYKIKGWLKIGNYFFDSGNNSHFDVEEELQEKTFKAENEEKMCSECIKTIEDFENGIQEKLYDLFGDFNNTIMKPLRRNVAVIGGKMNWNISKPSFSSLKDD
ncbi:MAG: hypothetical protein MJ252_11845 [archaeon]|nr:hypothetical protein [archaeon]